MGKFKDIPLVAIKFPMENSKENLHGNISKFSDTLHKILIKMTSIHKNNSKYKLLWIDLIISCKAHKYILLFSEKI